MENKDIDKIKGTGKFIIDSNTEQPENNSIIAFDKTSEDEQSLQTIESAGTELVASDPNKQVVLINDHKYEVLPYEKVKPFFGSELASGKEVLDDDYVYKITPETGALVYKETFELPADFQDASPQDKLLLIDNYIGGLVPYKEKKLTSKTMPKPLLKGVFYRVGVAALAISISSILYLLKMTTWHIFPLAGIYSFVYLWNAALTFYYAKTRNFKMFSGVVTNVETQYGWSPSLRKTYLQVSNGKKFLAFQYDLRKKKDIKIGTPVTVFIPNTLELHEGPLGPTADIVLGISFSLDAKASDKYGEYQDGRMRDIRAEDYFNDVN